MAKGYVYEHVVTPADATFRGLAYDGSYHRWACAAREQMITEYIDSTDVIWPGFLVGESYLRYRSPAFMNDRLEVRVTVGDHVPEKGWARLEFRFVNQTSLNVLAEGYQTIFFTDPETGKRVPIPEEFLKLIEAVGEVD